MPAGGSKSRMASTERYEVFSLVSLDGNGDWHREGTVAGTGDYAK